MSGGPDGGFDALITFLLDEISISSTTGKIPLTTSLVHLSSRRNILYQCLF
jgi:hypothetical protein